MVYIKSAFLKVSCHVKGALFDKRGALLVVPYQKIIINLRAA